MRAEPYAFFGGIFVYRAVLPLASITAIGFPGYGLPPGRLQFVVFTVISAKGYSQKRVVTVYQAPLTNIMSNA
jgi:hypothetical protein